MGEYFYSTRNTNYYIGTNVGGFQVGAGITVGGGQSLGRLIVKSAPQRSEPIFRLRRSDGSSFLKVHPTSGNIVMTGSKTFDVNMAGWVGGFRMIDTSFALDIGAPDQNGIAFAARVAGGTPCVQDTQFRFSVQTTGMLRWGDGAAVQDTNLYRSAARTLKTDQSFHVGADLRHLGQSLGFYNATPIARPAVTGSREGNPALADLLTKLAALGLITDNTTVSGAAALSSTPTTTSTSATTSSTSLGAVPASSPAPSPTLRQ